MSPEPKKPIEDVLEATAKARRAQFAADPTMPNPMRAQLHHEIARLARDDDSRRSEHWFRILWPRLAFTTAFALILVSISTLWWWREHQTGGGETMKLAMQEPAREAVHLHYYQGLSLQETADAMGVATSTVKYRQRQALSELQQKLAAERAGSNLATMKQLPCER